MARGVEYFLLSKPPSNDQRESDLWPSDLGRDLMLPQYELKHWVFWSPCTWRTGLASVSQASLQGPDPPKHRQASPLAWPGLLWVACGSICTQEGPLCGQATICLKESSSVPRINGVFFPLRLCEGVGSVNVCKYPLEAPLEKWLC